MIIRDNVYLFGGWISVNFSPKRMNDLYILDMLTMKWKRVHNNMQDPKVPSAEYIYSLTKVSESTALLSGHPSFKRTEEYPGELGVPGSWVLDLNKVQQLHQEPSSLWTRIPDQNQIQGRVGYASVIEPISKRLWIIGGHENNIERMDILEITTKISSLKELAINYAALYIPAQDPRLECGQLPKMLKDQIEAHRTGIGM